MPRAISSRHARLTVMCSIFPSFIQSLRPEPYFTRDSQPVRVAFGRNSALRSGVSGI
jgi:hypothetical protein